MSSSATNSEKLPIGELLGNSIIFFIGILFFGQFYLGVFENASPLFLAWLRGLGIVMCAQSCIAFGAIVAPSQKNMYFIFRKILDFVSIILLIWLWQNPDVIPVFSLQDGTFSLVENSSSFGTLLKWILTAIIFFSIIDLIQSIIKFLKELPIWHTKPNNSEKRLINL